MPLRIRFAHTETNVKAKEPPFVIINENAKWQRTYAPPWEMFYNIAEAIILILFFSIVSQPVIYFYFLERGAFVDAFYPEIAEEAPIYDISQVIDYYEITKENFHSMLNDSFAEIHPTGLKDPVLCEIHWLNGTVSEGDLPQLDLSFFRHISKIAIMVDFVTISRGNVNQGCSNWHIKTDITTRNGLSEFNVIPSISRTYCDASTMMNLGMTTDNATLRKSFKARGIFDVTKEQRDVERQQRELAAKFASKALPYKNKHLRNKDKKKGATKKLQNRFRRTEKSSIRVPPKPLLATKRKGWFIKENTQMFRYTNHLTLCLIILDVLHIIRLFNSIGKRYMRHKKWMNNIQYRNFPALTQIHFSIGYWFIIDILSSLGVLAFAIFVFCDSYNITQFPSQISIEVISFGMLFSLVRLNQWFAFHAEFYSLITILREAALLLFNLTIAIIPICTSFVLFGVFTFGLISKSFISVNQLVQRFITSSIGDSIDDFYIVIDDGTERTAWLSFFYVSCIVAGGMWILLTSCISSVMYIHESYAVKHDSFWKSSTISDSSSD